MKGMELSERYFDEYGKTLINDELGKYKEYIAAGLAGEGSECLGFDDELSRDHDFGPGFCIWVPEDIYRQYGEEMQRAYDSLPAEYMGCRRLETAMGAGRVGVMPLEFFYRKYTGLDHAPETNMEWFRIPESFLATAVNGKVFCDNFGEFTRWRGVLRSFYPEDVLKKKLERFPDEEVRTLLYHIIDSYEHSENRGVPMGNQSSQWFALYYLDRLDRLIKERLKVKYYVRYMDDGVLIHNDKEFLKKALAKMKELVEEDGLEFNSKTQIFPISQGVDFLGFHFYLTDTGKVIKRLRTSSKRRFKRRMKRFQKQYREGRITFDEITQSVRSYNGHLKHGHTWKLRKHIYSNTIFTKSKEDSDETIQA